MPPLRSAQEPARRRAVRFDQPEPGEAVEQARLGGAVERARGGGFDGVQRLEPFHLATQRANPSPPPSCGAARSPGASPDPTPRPLDHLTLRGRGDAPALLTREGLLDYAGLERGVGSLAAALAGAGPRPRRPRRELAAQDAA